MWAQQLCIFHCKHWIIHRSYSIICFKINNWVISHGIKDNMSKNLKWLASKFDITAQCDKYINFHKSEQTKKNPALSSTHLDLIWRMCLCLEDSWREEIKRKHCYNMTVKYEPLLVFDVWGIIELSLLTNNSFIAVLCR